jgi:hypothetical protein
MTKEAFPFGQTGETFSFLPSFLPSFIFAENYLFLFLFKKFILLYRGKFM